MVDKKLLEQKLAELMDIVPECEGLIAADSSGKVLVGQTITDMDHSKIAKACVAIVKDSNTLGKGVCCFGWFRKEYINCLGWFGWKKFSCVIKKKLNFYIKFIIIFNPFFKKTSKKVMKFTF